MRSDSHLAPKHVADDHNQPVAATGHRSFLRPPGGLAVWLFIAVEIITFGVVMLVYLAHRATDPSTFLAAQSELNPNLGFINTLILVTSGFLIAQGVVAYKARQLKKTSNYFFAGALLGLGFVFIKLFEYGQKITLGRGIGDGGFFSYYWGLTGFHFLHVLIGIFFLFGIALRTREGGDFAEQDAGVEAGAAYWHMCDLIWIFLFPLFYVLK